MSDKKAPKCPDVDKMRPVAVVHTDTASYAFWQDDPYQNHVCVFYGRGRHRRIYTHLKKQGYRVW